MLSYEEIKLLAKRKGLSLRDLAEKTGYEYSGFYKALQRKSLKYEARIILAKELNITVDELHAERIEYNPEQRSLSLINESSVRHHPEKINHLEKINNMEIFEGHNLFNFEATSSNEISYDNKSTHTDSKTLDDDYRYIIDHLKEQLRTKDEVIAKKEDVIEKLRERVLKYLSKK